MAKTVEQLAEEIFKEFAKDGEPVTKEEAMEIAREELNAKSVKHCVQSAEKTRASPKREQKIDADKVDVIRLLFSYLQTQADFVETLTANPQREITFKYKGGDYSLNLIKHRAKK